MISNKHLTKIVAVLAAVCLLFCGFIVYAASILDTGKTPEYQLRMFGDELMTIEILVDAEEWQAAVIGNAMAKEWIAADLIINGNRFSTVGIRTKGNSSLMQRGSEGNNSLQFKANKYVKGQTFFGLDTFCVNNMMGDATYMKDYIAYDIMNHIGVAAPLVNYASVSVNGEDYGFGIAIERYDKAFLDRAYSTAAGQLYNVKIGMGRRGDFEDMWQEFSFDLPSERQRGDNNVTGWQDGGADTMPDEARRDAVITPNEVQSGMNIVPGERQNAGRGADMVLGGGRAIGGFGGTGGGGSLIYTDDSIGSYSSIFDNAIFNPSDADKQRLILALKNLNAGTDLEKYIDIDAALRYFAAHTVVVNLDSYTSNMQQNYYLYERDGKLTILPWDYNLSFGGFMSRSASSTVNFPIDTPVSGVSMEDRPLLNMLLAVDEYRERYHGYLREIVQGYFESGLFEDTVRNLDSKINQYVKNDVSAFYSYAQYEASLPQFIELGRLRAESIKGQLEGEIPSTTSGQNADSSSLIDASSINLSALGSMMGGSSMGERPGGGGIMPDGQGGFPQDGGGFMPDGQGRLPQDGEGFIPEGQGGFPQGGGGFMLEVQGGFPQSGGGFMPDGQGRFPQSGEGSMPEVQGRLPQDGREPMQDIGDVANSAGTSAQSGADTGNYALAAASFFLLVVAIFLIAKPRKNVV